MTRRVLCGGQRVQGADVLSLNELSIHGGRHIVIRPNEPCSDGGELGRGAMVTQRTPSTQNGEGAGRETALKAFQRRWGQAEPEPYVEQWLDDKMREGKIRCQHVLRSEVKGQNRTFCFGGDSLLGPRAKTIEVIYQCDLKLTLGLMNEHVFTRTSEGVQNGFRQERM